jgi:hypothetical protein
MGFREETGTSASSPISRVSDETPADPYMWAEGGAESILDIWKRLITDVLEGLVRRHVQEYMERYLETAEESPRFLYIPDTVTTATVERAKRIRGARFAQKEKFVLYTAEELKNIF